MKKQSFDLRGRAYSCAVASIFVTLGVALPFVTLGVALAPANAAAAPRAQSRSRIARLAAILKPKLSKTRVVSQEIDAVSPDGLEIETRGLGYLTDNPNRGTTKEALGTTRLWLNIGNDYRYLSYKMDAQASITVNDLSSFGFSLREAYIASSPGALGDFEVAFGRKRLAWSDLDEAWGMGLWQPRNLWDPLRVKSEGNFGGFLSWKPKRARFDLFGSFLYVPEIPLTQSALKNAEAKTRTISGRTFPIQTNVQLNSLAGLLLNGSVGARAEIGEATGPWARVSYLYKPVHQLLSTPTIEPVISIATGETTAIINATPQIKRHHLIGSDVGYRSEFFDTTASITGEIPEQFEFDSTSFTTQVLAPGLIVGGAATLKAPALRNWRNSATGGFMELIGGETYDVGPVAASSGTVFGRRHRFRRASSLSLNSSLGLWSDSGSIGVTGRWVQDWSFAHSWWSSQITLKMPWKLSVFAGFDFIGAPLFELSPAEGQFLATMRDRDRIYGGLRYAF